MKSSYGLARGILRMFPVIGWLMIAGAMAVMFLPWGSNNAAVLSMALVLLICRVVMTFVSEMATAQLQTAGIPQCSFPICYAENVRKS